MSHFWKTVIGKLRGSSVGQTASEPPVEPPKSNQIKAKECKFSRARVCVSDSSGRRHVLLQPSAYLHSGAVCSTLNENTIAALNNDAIAGGH